MHTLSNIHFYFPQVKTIASEEAAETKQTSFNTALRGVDDHFVEEFMEITKRQFEGDQVEKVIVLGMVDAFHRYVVICICNFVMMMNSFLIFNVVAISP